jgi:hypothetical protein
VKRRQRLHVPKARGNLRVEADTATGATASAARPRASRYSGMKLPHERDESTHRPANPNPLTEQAAKDIEAGSLDTDCYGAVGGQFDREPRKR